MGESFNRTFMELKFPRKSVFAHHLGVLIVPLWNWNFEDNVSAVVVTWCFNRTFMELKYKFTAHSTWWLLVLIVPLWNWNGTNPKIFRFVEGFNRTFMELKSEIRTLYVSIISWLSVLYVLNGRKVTVWILYRYEMAKI